MSQLLNHDNENREAIEQLRNRMKDIVSPEMYEDRFMFYRFLKARDFELDKAELMLRNHINWRKIYQVETILRDFKPRKAFLKYINADIIGNDKEGSIVMYSPAGKIDTRDIVKCFKVNDYYRHFIWCMERIESEVKKRSLMPGETIPKHFYIFNMKDLEFANAIHPLCAVNYMRLANIYQDNYPERMKTLIFINAPVYVVKLFNLFKPILADEVIRKVKIYGKSGWKEKLLEMIDDEVLPAFLGGSRTDPDGNPMCNTIVFHGSRIPQNYFLTEADRTFKDADRVQRISISPRSCHEAFVDIEENGSIIEWEYEVKNKDIGFGLLFKESDDNMKEIIPVQKFQTTDGTDVGSYKCQLTGTYVFIFDNSFSWITKKDVSYCITVLKEEIKPL